MSLVTTDDLREELSFDVVDLSPQYFHKLLRI